MPYRDWLEHYGPPWLQGAVGASLLGEIGGQFDDLRDRLTQATKASMPTLAAAAATDAVPVIGDERQLERGSGETLAAWAERLRSAWSTWAEAGSHPGLLKQLALLGFDYAHMFLIQRSGRRSSYDGSAVTFVDGRIVSFDLTPPRVYSEMGVVFTTNQASLTYDSATGAFSSAAAQLNRVVKKWKPAKVNFMGTWILVTAPFWGWPTATALWGQPGRVWGGGSGRFIPPE